jgi:hypothetical protein
MYGFKHLTINFGTINETYASFYYVQTLQPS